MDISFEVLQGDAIKECRDLCDELMAFQKEKAVLHPEAFDGMNFDTRMKSSYDSALENYVVVMRDGKTPVGYAFCAIEEATEANAHYRPAWADECETFNGFYPQWLALPARIGCLNNLYLREAYRGKGYGSQLCDMGIRWLESHSGCEHFFVYVSNGNEQVSRLYASKGFAYSHDVWGGFIKAAHRRNKNFIKE